METRKPNNNMRIEDAIGNGNCAFNAFTLGFVRHDVLDALEKNSIIDTPNFKLFLSIATKLLNISNDWNAFKNTVLELRRKNNRALQEKLGMAFRFFYILLAKDDEKYKQGLRIIFNASIDLYIANSKPDDDVFTQHDFIKNKFQAAKKTIMASANVEIIPDLLTWWDNEGFNEYLTKMAQEPKNGDVWKYAGDLELALLGREFHLNLLISHTTWTPSNFNAANGLLPLVINGSLLTENDIHELTTRGVVNDEDDGLYLLNISEEELKRHLAAIIIKKPFKKHQVIEANNLAQYIDLTDPEMVDECINRNILQEKNGKIYFLIDSDLSNEKRPRFKQIPEVISQEDFLKSWRAGFNPMPTLILKNQHSLHWVNCVPLTDEIKPVELKKPVEFKKPLELKKPEQNKPDVQKGSLEKSAEDELRRETEKKFLDQQREKIRKDKARQALKLQEWEAEQERVKAQQAEQNKVKTIVTAVDTVVAPQTEVPKKISKAKKILSFFHKSKSDKKTVKTKTEKGLRK